MSAGYSQSGTWSTDLVMQVSQDEFIRQTKRHLRAVGLHPSSVTDTTFSDCQAVRKTFVRKGGLTLDGLGEFWIGSGFLNGRPSDVNECIHFLEIVLGTKLVTATEAASKAREESARREAVAAGIELDVTTEVEKRKTSRNRKWICPNCCRTIYNGQDDWIGFCGGTAREPHPVERYQRITKTVEEIYGGMFAVQDAEECPF